MTGVGGLFFLRLRKGSAMTRRRTLYLPAVLVACMVAVLAVSKKAKATFSGQNGKIAYVDYIRRSLHEQANGSAKTKVTNTWAGGIPLDYLPDGKKIAYTGGGGFNLEIYTVNVGGGGESKVTEGGYPSWGVLRSSSSSEYIHPGAWKGCPANFALMGF